MTRSHSRRAVTVLFALVFLATPLVATPQSGAPSDLPELQRPIPGPVVPPAFWWLSLLGASMLIVYYIWRKDPVSFLAQCFGWTVYVRNLWFIHAESVRAKK